MIVNRRKNLPIEDTLFRKLLASPENEWILLEFIEAMTGKRYESAVVTNPYNLAYVRKSLELNEIISDVVVQLDGEDIVTIEMQRRN